MRAGNGDQEQVNEGRYARQEMIFGHERQEALGAATVVVVGAGGLGSPAATYLAAAGIGRLVIADYDTVSLSNLNRQFLHGDADIGTRTLHMDFPGTRKGACDFVRKPCGLPDEVFWYGAHGTFLS